jgi:predicted nucleic-acid-binding protein
MAQAKFIDKTYLLDTNVILRFLLDDHPQLSKKAGQFMANISAGTIRAEIGDAVLAECVYVMDKFYAIPRNEIADALIGVVSLTGISNSNTSKLLDALLKYKSTGFDIVDCLLSAHSSPEKPVVSFDKDIEQLKAVYVML